MDRKTNKARRAAAVLACGMMGACGLYLCSAASQRTFAWSSAGAAVMLRNGWLVMMCGDVAAYGREVAQLEALHTPSQWMGESATWYRIKGLRSLSSAIAARGQCAGARRAPHIVYLWAHGCVVFIMLSAGLLTLLGVVRYMRGCGQSQIRTVARKRRRGA